MAYCSVTSSPQRFANCLTNFQLQDLLILKKSMQMMSTLDAASFHTVDTGDEDETVNVFDSDSDSDSISCNESSPHHVPQRMALMAADRGMSESGPSQPWHSSGDHHVSSWTESEEKPSKLQTLFQISITSLAFLSFGGYLLCLIVQAIKSKGTTYFHPVATATTTSNNGNVKRIKIYRRSKRSSTDKNHAIYDQIISNLHQAPDYATYMKSMREQKQKQKQIQKFGYAHLVGS
ncbi:hypothetical protein ACLKA6_016826 [Drosophila palustris]